MNPVLIDDQLILSHEMFILDANLAKALDREKMNEITGNLIKDLLEHLGMMELGPLEIFNSTDPRAPGWSFIQPITTSHISGHYFIKPDDTNPNIHMDFYSCKPFDWKTIIPILHQHLQLAKWHGNFMYRKDVMADREVCEMSGDGLRITLETSLNR